MFCSKAIAYSLVDVNIIGFILNMCRALSFPSPEYWKPLVRCFNSEQFPQKAN